MLLKLISLCGFYAIGFKAPLTLGLVTAEDSSSFMLSDQKATTFDLLYPNKFWYPNPQDSENYQLPSSLSIRSHKDSRRKTNLLQNLAGTVKHKDFPKALENVLGALFKLLQKIVKALKEFLRSLIEPIAQGVAWLLGTLSGSHFLTNPISLLGSVIVLINVIRQVVSTFPFGTFLAVLLLFV